MKGKKLTNEEFKARVNELFNEKYDLSKADVNNRDEKGRVIIICPIHGEFLKTPNNILLGHGCPKCAYEKMGKEKIMTNIGFIEKAKKRHGDKYDYSKCDYKGSESYVTLICRKHGEFKTSASNHLNGCGCPKCAHEKNSSYRSMTLEHFINKANITHNHVYDYSKVNIKKRDENGKICIICPKHGEFWQTPSSHLSGNGCPKCGLQQIRKSLTKTTEEFIEEAKKVHGDKYDYSKVNYIGSRTKVCIICSKHGEFWQTPYSHLSGNGCPKCADNQPMTTDEFIKRSKNKHGDKYDYTNSKYKNNRVKIEIICHKKDENGIEHGSFFTTPHSHMQGSGCPKCKQNYKLENEVRLLLTENNIEFEEKKIFEGLKYKQALRPDFYLPKENIIIECQGEQHFEAIDFGGKGKEWANKLLELNKKRDEIKRIFCKENGIKLLEYTHLKIKDKRLIKTKEKLLNEIKNARRD